MRKRLADWFEKVSVASIAVGVFQGRMIGIFLSILCFGFCMYITWRDQK